MAVLIAYADFGYVGGAPGKIDLYVGKEVVRRGIPMIIATDELIELIKQHGRCDHLLAQPLGCPSQLLHAQALWRQKADSLLCSPCSLHDTACQPASVSICLGAFLL